MPIHPLVGNSLRVIRYRRGRAGERSIDVEHPVFGTTMRIPERWTELAEPRPLYGATARATTSGLLRLAEAVRLIGEKSDFLTATVVGSHDES